MYQDFSRLQAPWVGYSREEYEGEESDYDRDEEYYDYLEDEEPEEYKGV